MTPCLRIVSATAYHHNVRGIDDVARPLMAAAHKRGGSAFASSSSASFSSPPLLSSSSSSSSPALCLLGSKRRRRSGGGHFEPQREDAIAAVLGSKDWRLAATPTSEAALQSVESIMTRGEIITVSPEDSLDHALELLVQHHVTGLPVVDTQGGVVGVVSDFDLLALEGVTTEEKARGFFPKADADWNSFFEVQKFVEKNKGRTVQDVMTSNPVSVTPQSSIEDAANLLLRLKIRRLPVVDSKGRLVGILTRSNIIKAAWEARRIVERK